MGRWLGLLDWTGPDRLQKFIIILKSTTIREFSASYVWHGQRDMADGMQTLDRTDKGAILWPWTGNK